VSCRAHDRIEASGLTQPSVDRLQPTRGLSCENRTVAECESDIRVINLGMSGIRPRYPQSVLESWNGRMAESGGVLAVRFGRKGLCPTKTGPGVPWLRVFGFAACVRQLP
jgi:hypothetical protein